jgi:hypothetical protein
MTDEPQLTPTAAAAKLDGLRADTAWSTAFLAGSGPHVAEYQRLSTIAIDAQENDRIDLAMKGEFLPINDSEHFQRMGAVTMLREAGLTDDVVKQALAGQPVSQAEYDAAARRKAALMKDSTFTSAFLKGNGPEKETMTLLNVILSSPLKQASA